MFVRDGLWDPAVALPSDSKHHTNQFKRQPNKSPEPDR